MINDFPEAPESVALALMQMIEEAENKDGRRRRGNNEIPERTRLLNLYAECLAAVVGRRRDPLRDTQYTH